MSGELEIDVRTWKPWKASKKLLEEIDAVIKELEILKLPHDP